MENDLYSRGYDMLQKGMPLDEIAEALGFHDVYSLLAGTCLRDLNLPTRIENCVSACKSDPLTGVIGVQN